MSTSYSNSRRSSVLNKTRRPRLEPLEKRQLLSGSSFLLQALYAAELSAIQAVLQASNPDVSVAQPVSEKSDATEVSSSTDSTTTDNSTTDSSTTDAVTTPTDPTATTTDPTTVTT